MSNIITNTKKNKIIKQTLIEKEIIKSKRIIYCGKWFNKKTKNSKIPHPLIFHCKKWECRVCRNELINELTNKHMHINSKYLNKGWNLVTISLNISTNNRLKFEEVFRLFKKSIRLLKDSRGWLKIKRLLNIRYHYDNTEVFFINNEYKFYNNITNGAKVINIENKLIEDVILSYWTKIARKTGLIISHSNSLQIYNYYNTPKNKTDPHAALINFKEKNIYERTKIEGSLENLEKRFWELTNSPPTNLKTIKYLTKKELEELGNVIRNIYSLNKIFRRGRIWHTKI